MSIRVHYQFCGSSNLKFNLKKNIRKYLWKIWSIQLRKSHFYQKKKTFSSVLPDAKIALLTKISIEITNSRLHTVTLKEKVIASWNAETLKESEGGKGIGTLRETYCPVITRKRKYMPPGRMECNWVEGTQRALVLVTIRTEIQLSSNAYKWADGV